MFRPSLCPYLPSPLGEYIQSPRELASLGQLTLGGMMGYMLAENSAREVAR